MLAMALSDNAHTLEPREIPMSRPAEHEVLLQVLACGVCRTDLHVIDRDLPTHRTHVVPGHEIVGRVVASGCNAARFPLGTRVGVPWLGGVCATCPYCLSSKENLCDRPTFTGYDRDGGFAQYACADEAFCFALPNRYDDAHVAPLLCAGLIGYRAFRAAALHAKSQIGLYGFGAAAHILCQLAVALGHEVYAFVRSGDTRSERFARSLGAVWAGASDLLPPTALDAALIFAPVGDLLPHALRATRKGGVVVCAGIHMSAIPSFDYALLWGERCVRSVANLTRSDGEEFFALIERHPIETRVATYPLARANEAIAALRVGAVDGAAVLIP
jgi:alcohol dehydrogenase, propanol-preferring